MFVVRDSQLEDFAVPFRKKVRENILADLVEKKIGQVYEDGKNIVVEDHRGNKTTLSFSDGYLPEKITKPSGLQYRFEFDDDERLKSVLFSGEETIGLLYTGHFLTGIQLKGALTKICYDEESRVTTIVYPDNKTTLFEYDSSGDILAIVNRTGAKRTFEVYLKGEQLVYRNTNALGRKTEFEIDSYDNITKVVFPDGSFIKHDYDEGIDAERTIQRNGLEQIGYYDDDYLDTIEFSDGRCIYLEGDEFGRADSLTNENGTVSYAYDEADRITAESFQQNTTTYSYDEGGLLTEVLYPSNTRINYEYDEDTRLRRIWTDKFSCDFNYNGKGTSTETSYSNKIIEQRTYGMLGGLEELKVIVRREIICHQVFGYDALMRVISCSNFNPASDREDISISYDAESRLIEIKDALTGLKEFFEYDKNGNMIMANGQNFHIGIMNEIRSIDGLPIEYDKAGNIISFYNEKRLKTVLDFNEAAQLISVKVNAQRWEYHYDALGRRISMSNGSDNCIYNWAGDKMISEEMAVNGQITYREYIYSPISRAPIGFIENTKMYWLHTDVRNAVFMTTDSSGEVVWLAKYDAFGNSNILVNKVRQPWRLMGQYCDDGTGLYYCYARYYCPYLRSYVSWPRDWLNEEMSYYSYALNSPFNRASPEGKSSSRLFLGAGISDLLLEYILFGRNGAKSGKMGKPRGDSLNILKFSDGLQYIDVVSSQTGIFLGAITPAISGNVATSIIHSLLGNS